MADSGAVGQALRIGTRASKLARWQAEWVAVQLRAGGHAVDLVEITTHGDADPASPIGDIGTAGVFTKQIQQALLAGEIDLAVHSLKDLPTDAVDGLQLAAIPVRESAADVLVARSEEREARSEKELAVLSRRGRVGTGSLRRQTQLLHARPDLCVAEIRGNVDTRLRKLDEGQFDAIVLAEAGLRRLGFENRITQVLPLDVMLPAVGQGAPGIECRAGDTKTQAAVRPLEDSETRLAVTAERALLAELRGGCMAPVGAWGRVEKGDLCLTAVVLSADGSRRVAAENCVGSKDVRDAEELGRRVAGALLAQGAAELIAASRGVADHEG